MRPIKTLCISIIIAFVLPTSVNAQDKLTLHDAVTEQYGKFYPKYLSQMSWIPNTNSYSYVKDNQLLCIPVGQKEKVVAGLNDLFPGNEEASFFPSIKWIDNESFIFKDGTQLKSYNSKTKKLSDILSYTDASINGKTNPTKTMVSYTVDNNLFIQNGSKEIQITDNPDHIVSGSAYARQEFGITEGMFWSEDGNSLAFYEKDESNVTEYPLVEYNSTPATVRYIKYPMAGSSSEIPSVGVYHVKTGKTVYLNLENGKKDDSFYATNLAWSPDNKFIYLAIIQRDQKKIWLKKYDANTGSELSTILEESNERYVEPEHPPIFVEGKDQFLWFSERDGFDNIYLYNTSGQLKGSTGFDFPITRFIGFTNNNKSFFVMATGNRAVDSQIFRVDLPSMKTTQITKGNGQHSGQISSDGKYIIDTWSSIDTPRKVEILDAKGKVVKEELNAEDLLASYNLSKPELFTLKSFDDTELWCRMIKPSNFDPSKKYPVLVYTYNGPHVQLVQDRYLGGASLWMYQLAEEGYIVFTVDGRGSKNRGFEFESAIHNTLGQTEVKDQEHCTKWLKDQPFTDPNKFAIHGWSYGGFMTTSLMIKTPGLFKVGVAGGPVIDWKYYEVMYTERYMDTPETNPIGYEVADLKGYVQNLQGDLLMIHGAIDDVVVMQHNMSFQKACIDKGVQVDFYAYPGHPHNVRGIDRVHLMTKVLGYIKNSFED